MPSPQPHCSDPASASGAPLLDDCFELLDEPQPEQKAHDTVPKEKWWYACSGDTAPRGPVSERELQMRVATGEIQQNDSVWRTGLSQWEPVAAHFGRLFSARRPVQQATVPHTSVWRRIQDLAALVGGWEPSPPLVRRVARGFWLCGLLTITGSLLLFLFGWSWFSQGLQLLLIAAALELTTALLQREQRDSPVAVEPSQTSQESTP